MASKKAAFQPYGAPIVDPKSGNATEAMIGWMRTVTPQATNGASAITALTGDVTAAGPGSVAGTLANTAVTPGLYGDSTHVAQVTFDAKGRATAASNVAIAATGTVTHTAGALAANELVVGNAGADIKTVAATDGQIPIGKTSDGSVTLATLTAGSGISVTNGAASVTIAATGGGGTVTHTAGALTANELVVGNGSADIKVVAATDGQIPIGKTSDGSVNLATITAGSNITVTNGAGSITIAATGGGGGTVTTTGSPVSPQLAQFSGSTSITGVSAVVTPQGRLTLTSATPYLSASVSAATTVYYTPAIGNCVPVYDGTNWGFYTFSELSQATTDTTKSPAACAAFGNYDLFVWNDTGTIRCTRGPVWTQAQTFTVTIASPAVFSLTGHGFYEGQPLVFSTSGALPTGLTPGTTYFVISAGLTANAFEVSTSIGGSAVNTSGSQSGTHTATQNLTVRGSGAGTTELTRVGGLLMNANNITNGPNASRGVYVGTITTNSSSKVDFTFGGAGAGGGESCLVGVWNMFDRVPITLLNFDNTATWAYTINSFRLKNAGASTTANRTMLLAGWQVDGFNAVNSQISSNTSANIAMIVAVGYNSTVNPSTGGFTGRSDIGGVNQSITLQGGYGTKLALGVNYVAPLERSGATGTRTWEGDNSSHADQSAFIVTTTY